MAVVDDVESIIEPAFQSDALKTIQDGIATFAESLPGVLKALDEVANIHPFIKGEWLWLGSPPEWSSLP